MMQYLFLSLKRILCFLLLFSAFHHSAAQNISREEIIQKLEDDYSKVREKRESTDEVVSELQRLKDAFSKIGHNEGILKCNAKLMTNFLKRAEYEQALELVEETEMLAIRMKDYKSLSTLYGRMATIHHNSGHYEMELKESRKSLKYAKKITDREDRLYQIGFASMQLVCYFRNMGQDSVLYYLRKSLYNFEQMNDSDPFSQKNRRGAMLAVYMDLGNFYANTSKPQKPDIAEPYYLLAYAFKKSDPYVFRDFDLPLLNSMAGFYQQKKEYEKAVRFALEALEIEKEEKRPDERIKSFTVLSKAYEKLHEPQLQLEYTNKYSRLSDSLNLVEKNTHEKQLKQAVNEADKHNKQEQQYLLRNLFFIGMLLIAALAFALFLLRKRMKKDEPLPVNEIKQTSTAAIRTPDEKKESQGIFTISDETINTLLKKLEKFEQSKKFLKNELNLTWLANHLNTNPKYLSEIINRFKGKNFSNYINHLRISYIVTKIKENAAYREYKISYLAQECGYASPQVFVIAFKKETGVPPSAFIESISKQQI